MSKTLTLELPEDVYEAVNKAAEAEGKSAADWIAHNLSSLPRPLTEVDREVARARFRQHIGAVSLGYPTGSDNEIIDADLAREYGSNHEDEA